MLWATGDIIWLTGQPGAGKTTLAHALKNVGRVDHIIDGDQLRAVQPEGYDERGRHANVARAQDIALYLAGEGLNVAVALVSPDRAQREWLKAKARVFEVYVHTSEARGRESFHTSDYEPPRRRYLSLDTGLLSEHDSLHRILHYTNPRKRRALFIGRWQPCHNGHVWLIRQQLDRGQPVLLAVRDIPPDERNPLTTAQTVEILEAVFAGEDVEVMTVPDIGSVNWGRGVGYDLSEHAPPEDVGAISATEVRRMVRAGEDGWREYVHPRAQPFVQRWMAA
jgi:adenylylsulfate kinase